MAAGAGGASQQREQPVPDLGLHGVDEETAERARGELEAGVLALPQPLLPVGVEEAVAEEVHQHGEGALARGVVGEGGAQDVLDVVKETDGFKNLMRSCPWALVDIIKQKLSSPGVCVIYARIFSE